MCQLCELIGVEDARLNPAEKMNQIPHRRIWAGGGVERAPDKGMGNGLSDLQRGSNIDPQHLPKRRGKCKGTSSVLPYFSFF